MVSSTAKEIFILGQTQSGKTFRPSDWAERLAGVMSQFRPGGAQRGSHLGYSPWCVPSAIDGVKCVIVNRQLRDLEPMAWDFCLNFARDNALQLREGDGRGQMLVSPTSPAAPPAPSAPSASPVPPAGDTPHGR